MARQFNVARWCLNKLVVQEPTASALCEGQGAERSDDAGTGHLAVAWHWSRGQECSHGINVIFFHFFFFLGAGTIYHPTENYLGASGGPQSRWKTLANLWKSYRDPFEITWKSFRNPIGKLWNSFGNPLKSFGHLRKSFGMSLEIHGNPLGIIEHPTGFPGNPLESLGNPMKIVW